MTVEQSKGLPPDSSALISSEDMELWLKQETADCNKARDLRLKEASEIVQAYSTGLLGAQEANEKYWQYINRWGEALPGTHVDGTERNEQIVASIDRAQGKVPSLSDTELAYAELLKQKPEPRTPAAAQNDPLKFLRNKTYPLPHSKESADLVTSHDDDADDPT
jgi:hypothetical protein